MNSLIMLILIVSAGMLFLALAFYVLERIIPDAWFEDDNEATERQRLRDELIIARKQFNEARTYEETGIAVYRLNMVEERIADYRAKYGKRFERVA